ncbi:thioredoxin [bacterium]|nr:thioredoxin [bacterium]
MAATVEKISVDDFETTVKSGELPVLVDFFTTWCPPCRAVAPILEQLSQEYAGKVVFKKLDGDEAPAIVDRYNIEGFPTFILFKGGKELSRQVGAYPKVVLKSWLEDSLGGWT